MAVAVTNNTHIETSSTIQDELDKYIERYESLNAVSGFVEKVDYLAELALPSVPHAFRYWRGFLLDRNTQNCISLFPIVSAPDPVLRSTLNYAIIPDSDREELLAARRISFQNGAIILDHLDESYPVTRRGKPMADIQQFLSAEKPEATPGKLAYAADYYDPISGLAISQGAAHYIDQETASAITLQLNSYFRTFENLLSNTFGLK